MNKHLLLTGAVLVALSSGACASGVGNGSSASSTETDGGPQGTQSSMYSAGASSGSSDEPTGDDASSSGETSGEPSGDSSGPDASVSGADASTGSSGSKSSTSSGHSGHASGSSSGTTSGSSGSGSSSGSASSGSASSGSTATAPDGDAGKTYATLPYRGLALSGAEFAASVSAQFNGNSLGSMPGDYYYPTSNLANGGPSWPATNGTAMETTLMDPFFLGKGMNTIRLPLRWERLQHSLSSTSGGVASASQVVATFDSTELAALESSVSTLTAAGFYVLIDIHNYEWYANASEIASGQSGDPIGSSNVPNVAFENLWIGIASLYANNPKVVFDIMNEPNSPPDPSGQPAGTELYEASQAAITGIRSIGANNLILICGNNYADPSTFTSGGSSDPLKNLSDPQNNFAFEIHAYPDNAYGTSDTCTTGSSGSIQGVMNGLQTFETWAAKYGMKGFLGEFSAGIDVNADSNCESAISQMLTFISSDPSVFIGWTYWAAGAGFGSSEPMNYPFFNGDKDSPQLTTLAQFLQ